MNKTRFYVESARLISMLNYVESYLEHIETDGMGSVKRAGRSRHTMSASVIAYSAEETLGVERAEAVTDNGFLDSMEIKKCVDSVLEEFAFWWIVILFLTGLVTTNS